MRALILPAVALALAGAVVLVGGRMVEGTSAVGQPSRQEMAGAEKAVAPAAEPAPLAAGPQVPFEQEGPKTTALTATSPADVTTAAPAAGEIPAPDAPQAEQAKPLLPSRMVAPAVVAPPELAADDLQREAPREPLSQLSLALPPQPKMKNEWAGTPFFRPVAVESAVFESMGRTIAISGVKSVPLDESCDYEGVSWQCGTRARTAFRLWLRGRALVCQLPDEEQKVTSARCRLAKQDAGSWLVANGWARADPDGPYVQAEEKARAQKMGIFGTPPDTSSISTVPNAPVSQTGESQPIMTEEGADPQPSLGPELEFPPAPPAP